MSDVLLEKITDGVMLLTLNRPDSRNALSGELYDALLEALDRAANDMAIGAVVVTGAGRAFCAGGDVKGMANRPPMTLEEAAQDLRRRTEIARLLHEMPKPTIAMVNGAAVGAGFSIALACDLRIAAESARFGTAFANVGLPGDFGGSYFLTHLVGPARARELYFLAEMIPAAQALDWGIVNRVVPDAELAEATGTLARRLAQGPLVAYRYQKANLNAAMRGSTLSEILDLESFGTARARATDDHRDAVRAANEKRPPKFSGR